jgi:hypothetical protein
MKKFKVSRVYATRMEWTVEAETAEQAKAMLNDEDVCPTDMADEVWLGPIEQLHYAELIDQYQTVTKKTKR